MLPDNITKDFSRWEGRIAHMYLDTKNLVTVGIGKMLPDVKAAQALPFVVRGTSSAASPAQIAEDFTSVKKQPAAMLAKSYRPFTKLDLPDKAIDDLLLAELVIFEGQLKANFAGYDNYPEPARRALLDMIYNLGLAGLLTFKNLKKAVESANWRTAAAECHRNGPSQQRNDWTHDLFLHAVK